MTYPALRLSAWLLEHVHEAVAYPICQFLGWIYYWLAGDRRRQVEQNLRIVFGADATEGRVSACARHAFGTLVANYYTLFHMRGYEREQLRRRLRLDGMENIESALAKGRGIVLASLHLGNVEILMQLPSLFPKFRFLMLVENLANAGLMRVILELRAAMGIELVTTDQPMRIIRRLKENGVVGFACDRAVTGNGFPAELFGKPARLPEGPVRIAARTGAALVPAYGWRDERGEYAVRVEPEIVLQRSADPDCDAQVNMRQLASALERAIRSRPCEWMAFQPIWEQGNEDCSG